MDNRATATRDETVARLRALNLGEKLDIWPMSDVWAEVPCVNSPRHGLATIWLTCGSEDRRLCATCGVNAVKARKHSPHQLTVDVLLAEVPQ